MKTAQKVILAAGLATLVVLVWKMDPAYVFGLVAQVGWGFALIVSQEAGAHLFNALGWRLAMRPEHARSHPLPELYLLRIAGDGVNYLTPSATIAGEFARAAQLNPADPFPVRLAGVVVAKCAQAAGQFLFVVFGVAWVVRGRIPALRPLETPLQVLACLALAGMVWFIFREWFWGRPERPPADPSELSGFAGQFRQLRRTVKDYPGRVSLSVLAFMGGFAWNTLEVWLICRFLGLPVDWTLALAIEVLSNIIDGLLFMVPAKVGTQEAGKTAIFAMLGLPARTGLAFGIVRHARELAWGGFGLALYTARVRAEGREGSEGRVRRAGSVFRDLPVRGHDVAPAGGDGRPA